MWLVAVYAIHSLGELCLAPIGVSMITRLSPPRGGSLAIGIWMFSTAIANYLAGTLESTLERGHVPIYGFLVMSSVGSGVLLLALTPLLSRLATSRAPT